jgi:hypothetical protein
MPLHFPATRPRFGRAESPNWAFCFRDRISRIQVTTILPRINVGWIVQWYLNVPTLLNTWPKVAPGASTPESHKPLFDVVVWLTLPPFVHLTFVPFAIVIVLGLKAKLMIFTRLSEVTATGEAVFPGDRSDAKLGTASEPTSVAASSVVPNRIGALRIPLPFML